MSDALRCPHCKTALPEQATFCAACGRRIEGWSLPKGATPAAGETALPGAEEATRQMQPTPSLLRAAALSVKKGARPAPSERRESRPRRSRAPLAAAMVLVAAGGGVAGFFVMRAHRRQSTDHRQQPSAPVVETEEAVPPVAPPAVTPTVAPPTVPTPAPSPAVAQKPKAKRPANRIASAPVAVKAPPPPKKVATAPGGLPHKTVSTDSRPLQMPTVQHETASAAPPPTEADDKQEAEARLDADGIRFVVRQHLPQVRSCYGRAFKDSSPGGTVEIGFAIDAQGHAKNVRTETNTTDSEGLAHCLEARVREWQFPRPIGGDYELIYPFVFAPGS